MADAAPGQGLDPEGAAAGEQVEDPDPVDGVHAGEHGEHRLAYPVARGPGGPARRSPQRTPPGGTGHDTHGPDGTRMTPEAVIDCVECGGRAYLLTTWPDDDLPQPGDIMSYRSRIAWTASTWCCPTSTLEEELPILVVDQQADLVGQTRADPASAGSASTRSNATSRAVATRALSRRREASLRSVAPFCRVPRMVPSPRSSRSTSASSKPSVLRSRAPSRSSASAPGLPPSR